jgi:hypothetical protein
VACRHLQGESYRIDANDLTSGPRGVLIVDEGAIDDVRQPALESTYRLRAGVAGSNAALQIGDCVGITLRLGHRDAMEGRMELAVADPGEPVTTLVARPHRKRSRAVVAGKGVAGGKATDTRGLADDLGGADGLNSRTSWSSFTDRLCDEDAGSAIRRHVTVSSQHLV